MRVLNLLDGCVFFLLRILYFFRLGFLSYPSGPSPLKLTLAPTRPIRYTFSQCFPLFFVMNLISIAPLLLSPPPSINPFPFKYIFSHMRFPYPYPPSLGIFLLGFFSPFFVILVPLLLFLLDYPPCPPQLTPVRLKSPPSSNPAPLPPLLLSSAIGRHGTFHSEPSRP